MNNKIEIVICKKNFGDFLKKGVQYNHFDFEEDDRDFIEIPYKYKYIFIYRENSSTTGQRFHLDKNSHDKGIFTNFYDYFIDEQEIRKLKLDKINAKRQ